MTNGFTSNVFKGMRWATLPDFKRMIPVLFFLSWQDVVKISVKTEVQRHINYSLHTKYCAKL